MTEYRLMTYNEFKDTWTEVRTWEGREGLRDLDEMNRILAHDAAGGGLVHRIETREVSDWKVKV